MWYYWVGIVTPLAFMLLLLLNIVLPDVPPRPPSSSLDL